MLDARSHPVAAPDVPVVLGLGGSLALLADPAHPVGSAIRERVGTELAELLRGLGIPGRPMVALAPLREGAGRGRWSLALRVNGRPCRYPDELPVLVAEYVRGRRSQAPETPSTVLEWCAGLLGAAEADEPARATLLDFLGLLSLEIVKARPSTALGEAQAVAYLEGVAPDRPQDRPRLTEALRRVLDLKISIADRDGVVAALEEAPAGETDALIEALVSALRIDLVEIRMPSAYLEQLTTEQRGGEEKFESLRDGLFVELGLVYPTFRFVVDETLKARTFASTVNHVRLLPRVGLDRGECLVNRGLDAGDGPELEVLGVTPNPATGRHATVVPLAAREPAEAAGLTTWNDVDFLILSLAANLRMASSSFVHEAAVDDALDRLSWAFPALISAAREELPTRQVARCVRALVGERVSVRNLRLVLEELLELEHANGALIDAVVFADETATSGVALELEDRLRLALAQQIQHQASRGTNTVVVYLLDPVIEEEVASAAREPGEGSAGLPEDRVDVIVDAVRAELELLEEEYPDALVPDILTSLAARRPLRALLGDEFPHLGVLAHEEVRKANVQPVARISIAS